jgi:hypothetical protein
VALGEKISYKMDSYKFWTVCIGILYHSSWRTSSNCFRDVGGGNLFLTVLQNCEWFSDVQIWWLCWSGKMLKFTFMLFKLVLENCIIVWKCLDHGMYLITNLSTYSLAVIWPWRVIMGPTEYCTTILLPKPSQNLHRVSLLEPSIPDYRLPWVFSKRKLFKM